MTTITRKQFNDFETLAQERSEEYPLPLYVVMDCGEMEITDFPTDTCRVLSAFADGERVES